MTARSRLTTLAVLIVSVGTGWWLWYSRDLSPVPPARVAQQERSPLALRIQLVSAGVDDELVVVVRIFDRRFRQSEAIRAATRNAWRGSTTLTTTETSPPDGWIDRIAIRSGPTASIPVTNRVRVSDGEARFVIAAASAPPVGASLAAALALPDEELLSPPVARVVAPPQPLELAVARGRLAQVLSAWDRLVTIGDNVIASSPASPWGHYFRGLAHEARGERDQARTSFQRALDRVTPGDEPPMGLVLRR